MTLIFEAETDLFDVFLVDKKSGLVWRYGETIKEELGYVLFPDKFEVTKIFPSTLIRKDKNET